MHRNVACMHFLRTGNAQKRTEVKANYEKGTETLLLHSAAQRPHGSHACEQLPNEVPLMASYWACGNHSVSNCTNSVTGYDTLNWQLVLQAVCICSCMHVGMKKHTTLVTHRPQIHINTLLCTLHVSACTPGSHKTKKKAVEGRVQGVYAKLAPFCFKCALMWAHACPAAATLLHWSMAMRVQWQGGKSLSSTQRERRIGVAINAHSACCNPFQMYQAQQKWRRLRFGVRVNVHDYCWVNRV